MPESIAHYKILESLGAGGLGTVYRARDTQLGRTVAVKVLPPSIVQDAAQLDALHETADRLMTLSHPNIAMLFDRGRDGGQEFLVFEFVQGQPLSALAAGGPIGVRRALEFGINLADALADAHAIDMIHGDIRPDTVVVTPKDRAKFVNFGLSQFTTGGRERVTAAEAYVSPEELAGGPADARSDIYSLGAVLFEMLTGRRRARGMVLSGVNPNVPAEVEQIVGRMLAANVDHRSQSAATVAAELRSVAAILDTRMEAAEAASVQPARRPGARRTGLVMALIAAAAAIAIAAWML